MDLRADADVSSQFGRHATGRPSTIRPVSMRRAAITAAVVTSLVAGGVARSAPSPGGLPAPAQVAIFYYAWYGTPGVDGEWLHWGQGKQAPPKRIGSAFYPVRGAYSSADTAVVRSQMREIAASG